MDRERLIPIIAVLVAALLLFGVLFVAMRLDSGVNVGGRFETIPQESLGG